MKNQMYVIVRFFADTFLFIRIIILRTSLMRRVANTLHGAADTVCGAADMMGVAANTIHGAADMMAQWVSQDKCQTPPIWKKIS